MRRIKLITMSCPITQCPFEDPIMVPCCGNSFERSAFVSWYTSNSRCPLCRERINGFDPNTAPTNRAAIVEVVSEVSTNEITANVPKRYAAMTISLGNINITKVSLADASIDKSYINVIMPDYSGSMSGSYWDNCISGIKYLETKFPGKNIYMPHNHDTTVMSFAQVIGLRATGGNSFNLLFRKFGELQLDAQVKNVNVIFMTDGIDSYTEDIIKKSVKMHNDAGRNVIIHSFGIGSGHHAHIIDPIRKLGNSQGVYCFADTTNNGSEEIYNKINLMASHCLNSNKPIKIIGLDDYTVDATVGELLPSLSIPKFLKVLEDSIEYEVEVTQCESDEMLLQVYSKVLAEIAGVITSPHSDLSMTSIRMVLERYLSRIDGFDEQKSTLLSIIAGHKIDNRKALDLTSGIYTNKKAVVNATPLTSYNHNATFKKSAVSKSSNSEVTKLVPGKIGDYTDESFYRVNHRFSTVTGLSIDALTSTGCNVMHVAAFNGNYDAIKCMLEENTFSDDYNNYGLNPMMQAAVHGWWISAGLLLNYQSTYKDNDLIACIVYCADHEYPKTAKMIYDHCMDSYPNVIKQMNRSMFYTNRGMTWFVDNCTPEVPGISEIIEIGNPSLLTRADPNDICWYHFHEAIQKECVFLQLLAMIPDKSILEEFDTGSSGDYGSPIIHVTITRNKRSLFKALVDAGVNIESTNFKGNTPLYMAAYKGNLDIFCDLIDSGANTEGINWDNETALMPACQGNNIEIATLLLEYGLNPCARNNRMESPLSSSVRLGRNTCVKLIFDTYNNTENVISDLMIKPEVDGFDCIMSTIEMNRPETFKLIHDYLKLHEKVDLVHLDKNAPDNSLCPGGNIWHMMAEYNSCEVFIAACDLGLFNEIDIYAKDSRGYTPIEIAIDRDNERIVQLITSHGVTVDTSILRPGTKVYSLFFDPLFDQLSAIDLEASVDSFFSVYNRIPFTRRLFGDVVYECKNNELETWLHIAAKYKNEYLLKKLIAETALSIDSNDSRGISPRFWAAINDIDGYTHELVSEIKEHFKGSMLLLFKTKYSKMVTDIFREPTVAPTSITRYTELSKVLDAGSLFGLRLYIIEALISGVKMTIQEMIVSWFIEGNFIIPKSLTVTCNHILDKCYYVVKGTAMVGIGSKMSIHDKVLSGTGTFIDSPMNELIIYEAEYAPVFKTINGMYFMSSDDLEVMNVCRANKYSIMQKNIRNTSYALTTGQVTGLLIELK